MRYRMLGWTILLLAAPLAAQRDLAPMARLAGCWEAGAFRESWVLRPDGSLLGAGSLVRGESRRITERLRIAAPYGRVLYRATPTGALTTDFLATVTTTDSFVVEAPEHDFPRRISYVFGGPDRINVLLTGEEDGKAREQRFAFTRMAECNAVADAGLASIAPGDRVRVAAQSTLASGRLERLTADSLLLRTDDGTRGLLLGDITTVWGRDRSTLRGATIGGVVGAAAFTGFLHLVVSVFCESTTGCSRDHRKAWAYGIVLGGAGGAILGATVGSFVTRWGQRAP